MRRALTLGLLIVEHFLVASIVGAAGRENVAGEDQHFPSGEGCTPSAPVERR